MTENRSKMSSGSKMALILVVGGILVALLAVKFRVFTPATTQPGTVDQSIR
jgi:hypothetical protein